MKKYLIALPVLGTIIGCKKNGVSPSPNIFGKWELTRRYGGNIYPPDTTYKAGNGNIYQFNSDSSYQQYINGTLAVTGTFHLQGSQLYFNNNSYGDETFYYTVSISGNVLTIKPTIPDIPTTEYDKIQN